MFVTLGQSKLHGQSGKGTQREPNNNNINTNRFRAVWIGYLSKIGVKKVEDFKQSRDRFECFTVPNVSWIVWLNCFL